MRALLKFVTVAGVFIVAALIQAAPLPDTLIQSRGTASISDALVSRGVTAAGALDLVYKRQVAQLDARGIPDFYGMLTGFDEARYFDVPPRVGKAAEAKHAVEPPLGLQVSDAKTTAQAVKDQRARTNDMAATFVKLVAQHERSLSYYRYLNNQRKHKHTIQNTPWRDVPGWAWEQWNLRPVRLAMERDEDTMMRAVPEYHKELKKLADLDPRLSKEVNDRIQAFKAHRSHIAAGKTPESFWPEFIAEKEAGMARLEDYNKWLNKLESKSDPLRHQP